MSFWINKTGQTLNSSSCDIDYVTCSKRLDIASDAIRLDNDSDTKDLIISDSKIETGGGDGSNVILGCGVLH